MHETTRSDVEPIQQSHPLLWTLWTMLIAVLFAGLAYVVYIHQRQLKTVDLIESQGVFVSTRPVTYRWLSDPALSRVVRGLSPVIRVQLARVAITPAEIDTVLVNMRQFPRLRIFRAGRTGFTDNDLARLDVFPELEVLDLDKTRVTDLGLVSLGMFPRLDWLVLDHTGITDAGLGYVCQNQKLKMLSLDGTAITDAGLELIRELPALENLYCKATQITPEGIAEFKKLRPAVKVYP